jgi:hypothetical protein
MVASQMRKQGSLFNKTIMFHTAQKLIRLINPHSYTYKYEVIKRKMQGDGDVFFIKLLLLSANNPHFYPIYNLS